MKNAYVYGCSFYDVAKDYELAKKKELMGTCWAHAARVGSKPQMYEWADDLLAQRTSRTIK